MKKQIRAVCAAVIMAAGVAQGQLIITQYYEGPSTNKWIELTNIGSPPLI